MNITIWAAFIVIGVVSVFLLKFRKTRIIGKALLNAELLAVIFILTFLAIIVNSFTVRSGVPVIALAGYGILLCVMSVCLIWKLGSLKRILCIFGAGTVLCAACVFSVRLYEKYVDNLTIYEPNSQLISLYEPYDENSRIVLLEENSELHIDSDIPVMDGATALFPVYSAFARAVYPESELNMELAHYFSNVLKCSTTTNAYDNIINGGADIIFVAAPSELQKENARAAGVELEFTPIGSEAFVFFVNKRNPIDDISAENIRKIYSGEITSWRELGIRLGEIKAFQRNEGSGSQSAMQRFMADTKLAEPKKEDVIDAMGGIITRVADYKNYKTAIGYTFRFYATEMAKNNKIKLLSMDGIYPSEENVANGSYPQASNFYAVTRSDASENTKKLLEWICGSQGQELISKTGYTPLKSN